MNPRVFLDALPWDFRSRNTDWRYHRFTLLRLADYEPDLTLLTQRSPLVSLAGNLQAIRAAAGRRIGMPLSAFDATTHRLSARELRTSGANLVFSHHYPTNAGTTPVVWSNAIVSPPMQRSYGISEQALQAEIDAKRPLFQKARKVQVYSDVELQRHRQSFPESADRFVMTPFFTPNVRACNAAALGRHHDPATVRILFVGNHAIRKGLPELLQAFTTLPAPVLARAHLTVISNFDRSPITVPTHPRIEVLRGATGDVVLQHMRQAHIFVNVAHFESLGVVFQEAMSQGMACLGPDWEVQRELLDHGNAGLNLRCDPTAIRIALEQLIEDEPTRTRIARNAWQRFQTHYAPEHAAAAYRDLFFQALNA